MNSRIKPLRVDPLNRRESLLTLLALGASSPTEAQVAGKVFRIGFVRANRPPDAFLTAFQQGLRELGYVEGKNIVIEYRISEVRNEQLPGIIEELMRLKVDLILASGAPPALAAQKVTKSLPVVFVGVNGPLELGLVSSLAGPAGNITGLAITSADLAGKRLELLKEMIPTLKRVAVLWNPTNPGNLVQLNGALEVAGMARVQIQPVPISSPEGLESAFDMVRGADGLLLADDPLFLAHRPRFVALVARSRLPAIYGIKDFVEAGGLMTYGADLPDMYRRSATFVDKILRGAKPADLPVEQPMRFELIVNGKTARTLGLKIPYTVLLRANQVIE